MSDGTPTTVTGVVEVIYDNTAEGKGYRAKVGGLFVSTKFPPTYSVGENVSIPCVSRQYQGRTYYNQTGTTVCWHLPQHQLLSPQLLRLRSSLRRPPHEASLTILTR